MKTIKPLRASVLTRPYQWRGQVRLGVGIYILVRQHEDGWVLESDQTLWSEVLPSLDSEGMLDQVMIKAHPEYLVSGFAYSAHQARRDACMVSVEIGDLKKDILVTGDRYWVGSSISKARDFERIAVNWNNAYGGASHDKNKVGKGLDEIEIGGTKAVPLPNVENPLNQIASKSDKPPPASFGPIGPTHPDRFCLQGTYSDEWFKYDFPGFLPDMNPKIFNMALDDQHWKTRQQLPLGEPFKVWNMHPEKHCWQGLLPDLRARAFIAKDFNGVQLTEVTDIAASTVWLLPERESLILMFHGSIEIEDEDADDIAVIMGALEWTGQPRSMDHYQRMFELRSDPENALDHISNDSQLTPENLLRPLDEEKDYSPDKSKLSQRIDRYLEVQEQQTSRILQEYGVPEDSINYEFVGPLQDLARMSGSEMQAYIQKNRDDANEQLKSVIAQMKESNQHPAPLFDDIEKIINLEGQEDPKIQQVGPPDLSAFDQNAASKGSVDTQNDAQIQTQSQRLKGYARKGYFYTARYQLPAPRLAQDRNQVLREEVVRRYEENKDLTCMDLTGIDLSGLHLIDANFSESFLENSLFFKTRLEGANFSDAVLTRCKFDDAIVERTDFSKCNLADARIVRSALKDCTFTETDIEGASFEHSTLYNCQLARLMPDGFNWTAAKFENCFFDMCILSEGRITKSHFLRSKMNKVAFVETELSESAFENSELTDTSFSIAEFTDCEFRASTLKNVLFEENSSLIDTRFLASFLHECNFMDSNLDSIQFYKCNLIGSDFTKAVLHHCNFDKAIARDAIFYKADLTGSSFRHANLIQATLEKANLSDCDFSHATLFRTNVSKVKISPETRLSQTYRDQLEIYPLFRDALNAEALFKNE